MLTKLNNKGEEEQKVTKAQGEGACVGLLFWIYSK